MFACLSSTLGPDAPSSRDEHYSRRASAWKFGFPLTSVFACYFDLTDRAANPAIWSAHQTLHTDPTSKASDGNSLCLSEPLDFKHTN